MKQQALSRWLRALVVMIGAAGLVLYAAALPALGKEIAAAYPEFAWCYWPWLLFLWASGVPCYAVLALAWRVFAAIGRDRSFTPENARRLRAISLLAGGDSAFFFLMNALYLLLGMSHPSVVLASMAVVFAGVCVAAAAGALSHLADKAAALQEQSDWTV